MQNIWNRPAKYNYTICMAGRIKWSQPVSSVLEKCPNNLDYVSGLRVHKAIIV